MKRIDVSASEPRDMLSVRISDDIIDLIKQDPSYEESVTNVVLKIKRAYPIKSKIWVSDDPLYKDRTFGILCNGYNVAGCTLDPEDDFLECLEQCLEHVMEQHYQQILKLESRKWWKKRVFRT